MISIHIGADGKRWRKHPDPEIGGWWSEEDIHRIELELARDRALLARNESAAAFAEGQSIADDAQRLIASEHRAGRRLNLIDAVQRAVDLRRR